MTVSVPTPIDRRRQTLIVLLVSFLAIAVLACGALSLRLSALRSHRAVGPGWSFPSRIYSDGVTLDVGRILSEEYLLAELGAREYSEVKPPASAPGTWARIPGGFEVALRGLADIPDPAGRGGPERVRFRIEGGRLTALDRAGALSGAVKPDQTHPPRIEPRLVSVLLDEDRVLRTWVSLPRIPKAVRDAVVASEDRRFYEHAGMDPRGILRALFANARSGDIQQGGSTITQQLARALFLGRERTVSRKLLEIPIAMGLEILLSKDQILEMYLNSVYWGQAGSFGVGGVAEAGRWYFGAPVESLGVLEGATLAAIIPAPNEINPFKNPALVKVRRDRVLEAMVETKRLPAADAAALRARAVEVREGPAPVEQFPAYSGYVRDFINHQLSKRAATGYGLSIFTAMDLAWQRQAEAGLAEGLSALDGGRRGRRRLQGAFVALQPSSSTVSAMVGGRQSRAGDYNRAYQSKRQTGSAIKPIVYAAAISSGQNFTAATTVSDSVRTFGKGRWAWRPKNYDGSQHASVTLGLALERSLNIATSNLVEMIGAREVARVAGTFGLGKLKPVASIGLGSNEISLLDLTNAFAVFANRGLRHVPTPLRAVVDHGGKNLLAEPEPATTVIPEDVAAVMTGMLQNVVRYGVANPLVSAWGFNRPVAGKTGTTDNYKDAWFIAYTPDIVAGVWVGYDRPRSIGEPAGHTALPVWARIVGRMLAGYPPTPFAMDSQLEWRDIEPWTGFLADSMCTGESMPFIPGTTPVQWCSSALPPDYESMYYDSLAAADTAWREEYDENGAPLDTLQLEDPRQPARPEEPDTLSVETMQRREPH